ncbi:MAG TPA: DUF4012 domain-containing protein [Dictyobacter sp.]|jgi:hypothetical protein|nr:DUF4012 domain-containing protein [Dictyobacter sp.]
MSKAKALKRKRLTSSQSELQTQQHNNNATNEQTSEHIGQQNEEQTDITQFTTQKTNAIVEPTTASATAADAANAESSADIAQLDTYESKAIVNQPAEQMPATTAEPGSTSINTELEPPQEHKAVSADISQLETTESAAITDSTAANKQAPHETEHDHEGCKERKSDQKQDSISRMETVHVPIPPSTPVAQSSLRDYAPVPKARAIVPPTPVLPIEPELMPAAHPQTAGKPDKPDISIAAFQRYAAPAWDSIAHSFHLRRKLAFWRRLSPPARIALATLILLPSFLIIFELINTYVMYNQAQSGVQHLTNIKNIFTSSQNHAQGFLDITRLHEAEQEMQAAHADFQQLNNELQSNASVTLFASMLPQQINSARALSRIGVDGTDIGQQLIQTAETLAPTFRGPLLESSSKPLVTQSTLNIVQNAIVYALPQLEDIKAQSQNVTLNSLPLSNSQKQQLNMVLTAVPQALSDLTETHDLGQAIGWILGVDQPRTFLLQTMDRGELRATGGFTGQYGALPINGGRIGSFTLQDIGTVEEHNVNSNNTGVAAPAPFTWWPIANWGLRDSNLSADFPTSAKLAMQAYQTDFGKSVDGVIVFSPFLIESILQVTGPLSIPLYHETITAQNLEAKLHYYQLDHAGISKEKQIEHINVSGVNGDNLARKLFTRRLSNALMDHIRQAPPDELISLGRQMLYDLKTKDLQIYVNNPTIEQLIGKYGSTGAIDTSTSHDGLYVTQVNLSVSKASTYVRTYLHDTVSLDSNGGATHVLQMTLDYTQLGDVYGYDTYRDYVRIYVPPNSKYLWGNGFSRWFEGETLCGGSYQACPEYDPYGDGSLLCAPNVPTLGAGSADWYLNDPYYGESHPLNVIGGPTNMNSDQPGRAMYGGWVIVPKNCNMTVTLSWYVPPTGHPYSLLVQRQADTDPILDLTILPASTDCQKSGTSGMHYDGVLGTTDRSFTLPKTTSSSCYPQPKV